jgi:GNAT superfamily N-acetyltransferase
MNAIVEDVSDEDEIMSLLDRERSWAVYGICDLDQSHPEHARFVGARVRGTLPAVLLVFSPPGFTSLIPFGEQNALSALISAHHDLPQSALYQAREGDLDALRLRYSLAETELMYRMQTTTNAVATPSSEYATIRKLSVQDSGDITSLYDWGDTPFYAQFLLAENIFFGAFREGELIATAGTHAFTRKYDMAVIGGVFTHPMHRGHGLATATTGAVMAALAEIGVTNVALNVRRDNEPAIRVYTRLGFTVALPFVEGRLTTLTTLPDAP